MQEGDLFSSDYFLAEASNTFILGGFIEYQIVDYEGAEYDFMYNGDPHKLVVNTFDDNAVNVTVFSHPHNLLVKILETEYVDFDDDNVSDISITYLGLRGDKADIRIRQRLAISRERLS